MTTTVSRDIELTTQTSQGYIEGCYSVDAKRMRRCLHPALVKRTLFYDPGFVQTYCLRESGFPPYHGLPSSGQVEERWFIVNVLWELRERKIGSE
jgi:hypothetical protein